MDAAVPRENSDSERLDWLVATHRIPDLVYFPDESYSLIDEMGDWQFSATTWRECIDLAMKAARGSTHARSASPNTMPNTDLEPAVVDGLRPCEEREADVSDEALQWSDVLQVLCRAYDDGADVAMEEFRAWYKPHEWLHIYRALGAFIGRRNATHTTDLEASLADARTRITELESLCSSYAEALRGFSPDDVAFLRSEAKHARDVHGPMVAEGFDFIALAERIEAVLALGHQEKTT